MDFNNSNNYLTAVRTYNLSREPVTYRRKKRSKSSRTRRTGSCKSTHYNAGKDTIMITILILWT